MRWRDRLRSVQYRMKNEQQTKYARELRKNMTAEERKLWYQFLRDYPVRIMRQRPIDRFIVDFYCAKAKIAIELDGSQHFETEGHKYDNERDRVLKTQGITVIRVPNNEVNQNFYGVCEYIDREIRKQIDPSVSFADSSLFRKGAYKEEDHMKTVEIYTDGACSGNPGPGGWGAVLRYNGAEKEISGGEAMTTNNRMELTAVIQALLCLKEKCAVELYSDSKYVIDALDKGWAWGWRKKGWVKSDKKPALNPDLWEMLLDLTMQHEMHYHWVKGHADNEFNNRCDQLAVMEREKFV